MTITYRGKMSTFGGPDDVGVDPDEGLALVTEKNFEIVKDYFLPQQLPGTKVLARNLNPEKPYIACRWDYKETSKAFLLKTLVKVKNPQSVQTADAKPVDWGPHKDTGRIADLSPGLAATLGLQTDDDVEVTLFPDFVEPKEVEEREKLPPPERVFKDLEVIKYFGDFNYEDDPDGSGDIFVDPLWEEENLVEIFIPALKRKASAGKVICHELIAEDLKAAFAEIERQKLTNRILTFEGGYSPRHMNHDPDADISRHSWGIAIDINARWNAYGVTPPAIGARGSVRELVPIFESCGFFWGGKFKRSPDGMHFEYARPPKAETVEERELPDKKIPGNFSDLFKKLAVIYAGMDIDYPNLKATTLAQWALESGRGRSTLAKDYYNFAGMKFRPEMSIEKAKDENDRKKGGFATPVDYEAHDGVDEYCKFASLEEFIKGYWRFIRRSPYKGFESHTGSGKEYISFIKSKGYAADAGYVDKVLGLVPETEALLEAIGKPVIQPPPPIPQPTAALQGTIVIDPGHGGSKNHAVSPTGVKEKDLALKFGLLTKDHLEEIARQKNYDIRVVMTRDTDEHIGITERAYIARDNDADLLLSIHMNAANGLARGVEAYVKVENRNVNYGEDKKFAERIVTSIYNTIKKYDPKTENRGVKPDTQTKPGSLGVLNDASLGNTEDYHPCRACLVEVEFLDNPDVDELLNTGPKAHHACQDIAKAMAQAMIDDLLEYA